MKNYGIILASGTGTRFRSDMPKQFAKIAGKTVLEHTLEVFERATQIDQTVVVISPEYRHMLEGILLRNSYRKVSKILNGGDTRKESSYIGIASISDQEANVIIHDCARPFLSQRIITDCMEALDKYDAVDVAIKAADTIIQVDDRDIITAIPDRSFMRRGQTPQCFKLSVIKKAHELSAGDGGFTDDCGLVLRHGLCDVFVVEGDNGNMKITHPEDIFMADKLFQMHSSIIPEAGLMGNLKNKVIVVFGGGKGIGEHVIDMARSHCAKPFSYSVSGGCDVANYDCVAKALREVCSETGRIDCIVNTAGILRMGKLLERDIDEVHKEIAVNYMGSIHVAKAGIPYLRETKGALVLFTSSSYTRGRALYSTYSSTKSAIVNLTQALAEELYADGIRINVINPERTATPMRFAAFGKEPGDSLLSPEAVADATLKTLLSDLTGQVIDVRKARG